MTVTVELAFGARSPGGGAADTVYCASPGPVTPLMAQFMLAVPLLVTAKVCDAGAAPPHVAAKARDVGATDGPPPTPNAESGSGEGRGAQRAPVAVMPSVPVVAPAALGENVTASVWVPLAATEKLALEAAKGEGPEPAPVAARVTLAGALPVFVTLKFCDAACRSTT